MAIVVISHQMGAGGPEIGTALAQRLGYRYVNQELLLDAARRYGLAEGKLSHLEESKPTLFERFDTETRHHITVLQTTQFEFAETDDAVLMRGGGQWLLRGVPHALRVRLVAPFEHRVKQWIKRTAEMTGETPNQQVALATHPETRRYRINVEAQGDVVTLEGTTALGRAVEVAKGVKGVREVRTQQVEIPPIPPFVA